MNLPLEITPCPIVEAVIEVRFESSVPGDAIFGIVYKEVKDEFPRLERLPILQIPESIRSSDQNLIFSPHYKLTSSNYALQIGPKVFSLSNINGYCGWTTFFEKIHTIFEKIFNLNFLEKITRLGLRYINIFDGINIYERSNLELILKDQHITNNVNLTILLPANKFINTLRMVTDAKFVGNDGKELRGSVIDIDTSLEHIDMDYSEGINDIINSAHLEEKTLFFKLLKEEYIKTLTPRY